MSGGSPAWGVRRLISDPKRDGVHVGAPSKLICPKCGKSGPNVQMDWIDRVPYCFCGWRDNPADPKIKGIAPSRGRDRIPGARPSRRSLAAKRGA